MEDFWILKSIKKVESKSLLWFFKIMIKEESEHTKSFDFWSGSKHFLSGL